MANDEEQRDGGSDKDVQHHGRDESPREFDHAKQKQPHKAVGFWHSKMAKVRKDVIMMWLRTILILMISIIGVLSLYWAVLFSTNQNLRGLVVYVVDFDGQVAPYNNIPTPLVGPTVTKLATQMVSMLDVPTLGWTVITPDQFDNDPMQVREAVYDWKCWAAVVVNPNATALLQDAVATGNASYSPSGSVQIVYQTARDQTTVPTYIMPYLEEFSTEFSAMFGPMWGKMIMNNNTLTRENLARASTAVNPGIAPLLYDLRPFTPETATPAVSVGLIYLIIMAFFSFSFFLPIHMKYVQPQGHPPLHFYQLILWRLFATLVAYFFISLSYSVISLAFQIPFWPGPASHTESPPNYGATAYGRASFVVYWMLNFVGMTALGIACENVAMIIGQPWTALWLIFWVITNVSTSFYAIDTSPGFYKWGYAWPLHQVVEASRQIMFDLHSRIGLNFGILFVWAAVGVALFPFCCYFQRWQGERQERQKEKDKDKYVVETEDTKHEFEKKEGEKPPVRKRGFFRGV